MQECWPYRLIEQGRNIFKSFLSDEIYFLKHKSNCEYKVIAFRPRINKTVINTISTRAFLKLVKYIFGELHLNGFTYLSGFEVSEHEKFYN